MAASPALGSVVDVESFLNASYGAWGGTDEDRMMSYYAEKVVLQMPGTRMEGKEAVREQCARRSCCKSGDDAMDGFDLQGVLSIHIHV